MKKGRVRHWKSCKSGVYYYDMSGEVKYHLAEASHNAFSFDICEVDEENLSKIYDNLGKAYLDMDVLRLEKDID